MASFVATSSSPAAVREEIEKGAAALGYASVKPKQLEAVTSFLGGNDVFISLPTGYGKRFCYGCLPTVFKGLGRKEAIAIVVSPLMALMKDQVQAFQSKGVSAGMVSRESEEDILGGKLSLVFISPETLLTNAKFRSLCRSDIYKERLVALVVDEAHCVKKW